MLPLGLLGPRLRGRAVRRRGARRRGHRARSAARVARSWRGACSARRRGHRRGGGVPGGAKPCAPRGSRSRRWSCRRASIPTGSVRSTATDGAPRRAGFGLDPDDARSCSASAGSCPRKGFDVLIDAVAGLAARRAARDRRGRAAIAARLERRAAARRLGGSRAASSAACPTTTLPALVRQRRRVRDALPRPLGRARGRGVRHRVPRGGGVRRARRSRAAAVARTRRSSTARPASSSSLATATRCEPRSPGSSRHRSAGG